MKYRVIEKNGLFYPQFKNDWKTLWMWENICIPAHEQYENIFPGVAPIHYSEYVQACFMTFEGATSYCKKHKEKHGSNIIQL